MARISCPALHAEGAVACAATVASRPVPAPNGRAPPTTATCLSMAVATTTAEGGSVAARRVTAVATAVAGLGTSTVPHRKAPIGALGATKACPPLEGASAPKGTRGHRTASTPTSAAATSGTFASTPAPTLGTTAQVAAAKPGRTVLNEDSMNHSMDQAATLSSEPLFQRLKKEVCSALGC